MTNSKLVRALKQKITFMTARSKVKVDYLLRLMYVQMEGDAAGVDYLIDSATHKDKY